MSRKTFIFTAAMLLLFCGCSSTGLYSPLAKWLLRENAIPHYAARFDVIYIYPVPYTPEMNLNDMHSVVIRDCKEKFGNKTRVFSPLVNNGKDLKEAVEFYLKLYHGKEERPFVLLGNGEGGELLRKYVKKNRRRLAKQGMIFQSCGSPADKEDDFVTDKLVLDVQNAYEKYKELVLWRRELPTKQRKEEAKMSLPVLLEEPEGE